MKKYILILLLIVIQIGAVAQSKDRKLFKINGESTYTSEFKKLFYVAIDSVNQLKFDENLQLMINYKLKLNEAKVVKIDTLPTLVNEYVSYKENLAKPYLTDDETLERLIKEAYDRTNSKVKASHILIKTSEKDTVKAYQKILEIKKQLANGANFSDLAFKLSEDPSAKTNKGDLGYFNAFRMVYPFESAAFNTEVGEVSDLVKTKFGYHLIKVEDKIETGQSAKVAHIMIFHKEENAEQKISEIYNKLAQGKAFDYLAKKYSQDRNSTRKGGLLEPFTKGTLPKSFENVAFNLENGKYSKPFKTKYGWHIVKKYGLIEPKSFDVAKKDLRKKVMSRRKDMLETVVCQKIEAKYNVVDHKDALNVFKVENVKAIVKDSLVSNVLTIGETNFTQQNFYEYLALRGFKNVEKQYKFYKREKLKKYYVTKLEVDNEEFKETLATYKNGLMIFELMKKNIWDIPSLNPEKVKEFYSQNTKRYIDKGDSFEKVKGYVENDYQDKVQQEWLASLRAKNKIKLCKNNIKKLKKNTNK